MANSNLAYRSSISIKSISNSVSGLREGISNTQKTAINMSSVLSNNNKQKRDQISRSESLFQKRREAVKRREQEDIVEASSIGGAIKRTGKVVTNSTKGFLGRIFDAVGVLMIGWLVNNLPMIIDLAGKLSKRVQKLFGILSTGVSGISDILLGFGGVLSGLYSNIISFDFTDSQGKIGKSFDRITDGFDRVERSIRQTIRLLAGDLNRLFGFDTKVDEFPLPSDEDITPGSGGRVSGGTSDFWTLVAVVSREDSDAQGQADVAQSIYNRAASGAYGTSNIRELILRPTQYQPTWDYPKKGKDGTPNPEWYQIRDAESAAKASGFSVGTIRSVAANLLNKTLQKKAAEFVQGRTDFKGFEVPGSIQRKAGDNYFGWEYNYRGTGIAPVPQLGAKLLTLPELKNVKLKKGDVLTDVIGRGVEYIEITDVIGSSRDGGSRKHAGIDIGAPSGTYISLRVDCEVVGFKSAQSGGGYGNVIDVWVPTYGVQLRFAHCKNLLITSGKIKAETSFATVGSTGTGRITGPHIHLEYTKQRGRMSGSDGDPSPYVGLLLLTNGKLQASAATTTTNKTSNIAQINIESSSRDVAALKKEKSANVITVQAPQQPQQVASAPIMSDSGPSFTPSGDNVNTFITKKFLLDLAYT